MRTAMAQGARRIMRLAFGQRVADAVIAELQAGVEADRLAREDALRDTVDAMPGRLCPCAGCRAFFARASMHEVQGREILGDVYINGEHAGHAVLLEDSSYSGYKAEIVYGSAVAQPSAHVRVDGAPLHPATAGYLEAVAAAEGDH